MGEQYIDAAVRVQDRILFECADSEADIVNSSHRYILHEKDSNCDYNNVISAVSLLHRKSSYHLMEFRIQTQFIRSHTTSKFIR